MGDRGNIRLKEASGKAIYLYTHWGGYEIPQRLKAGLKAGKERWGDPSYLNRVIIETVIDRNKGVTGFGISCERSDNERDILEVDHEARKVRRLSRDGWHEAGVDWEKTAKVLKEWTFEEFCRIEFGDEGWDALGGDK